MIIEHLAGGDPVPVYARFAERGRMASSGLEYVASWVASDLTRCFQVMECADLVHFDVVEVMTSAEAVTAVGEL